MVLTKLPKGLEVSVKPVLPPKMTPPEVISDPSEWRIVGIRRHEDALEILAVPRLL